ALKAVGRLAGIVDKAKGVLRRVQTITDDITRAATEEFQKLVSGGSGSCAKHSFVATTLVLMADGSTKPIAEVEIGDKVKATDPTTGETTARSVVATIVHTDEDDMTRLTVTADDGTTGTVDATSWHPVWVEAEDRFVNIGDLKPGQQLTSAAEVASVRRYAHVEPVYDLTVDGIHTYHVAVGSVAILVHNCEREDKVVDLTLEPGPYAKEGVSVAHGDRIDPVTEQPLINESGDAHGCQTCGVRSPGTKSGNWIGDHVPANKLVPSGPFTAYPHCTKCARTQGGVVNGINREWYDFLAE
ncbi:Hint domain-containing protein, partial [Saccharothrix carnea]